MKHLTDEEIIRRGVTGHITARASAVLTQRFRDNMARFGYTPEQIAELEREATEWAKVAHEKLQAAYPDAGSNKT